MNMMFQCGDYGSVPAAIVVERQIEFLIKADVEINMIFQSGNYGNALTATAAERQIMIVEFLVEKNVDVNKDLQSGWMKSSNLTKFRWVECQFKALESYL